MSILLHIMPNLVANLEREYSSGKSYKKGIAYYTSFEEMMDKAGYYLAQKAESIFYDTLYKGDLTTEKI